jgi:hypothetical protein
MNRTGADPTFRHMQRGDTVGRDPSHQAHPPHRCTVRIHDSTRRYRRVNRLDLLDRLSGRDWRYGEMLTAICQWYGCAESTARRNIRLAIEYNYIQQVSDGYRITPLAESQLEVYGRLMGAEGIRFARYCSGRPGLHLLAATPVSADSHESPARITDYSASESLRLSGVHATTSGFPPPTGRSSC